MATQSEFMAANNPYTDLPTRASGESLYQYLLRLSNARGGMMLGTNSPTVDDVVAEEITTQPLGVLIKQDSGGDGGDDNNRDTRTPEERQRDMMERAVGLLRGEAASAASIGSLVGLPGMALGAFADYDNVQQFENQLKAQGFTPDQIEAIKDNPSMLQQGLQTGQFGVVSKGYEPTLFDKFSIKGLFSDIFGEDKPSYSGPDILGITGLGNVTARTPTYAGAVNYAAPFQTQGLLTGAVPFSVTPGVGTVLAPGNYGASSNSSNMGWGTGVSGAGEGGFGGGDSSTVSQGTTGGFESATFDSIANDPSWGGGGNDNNNDSGTDHGFGPGNDDGWD
jgi:hypothetical protein